MFRWFFALIFATGAALAADPIMPPARLVTVDRSTITNLTIVTNTVQSFCEAVDDVLPAGGISGVLADRVYVNASNAAQDAANAASLGSVSNALYVAITNGDTQARAAAAGITNGVAWLTNTAWTFNTTQTFANVAIGTDGKVYNDKYDPMQFYGGTVWCLWGTASQTLAGTSYTLVTNLAPALGVATSQWNRTDSRWVPNVAGWYWVQGAGLVQNFSPVASHTILSLYRNGAWAADVGSATLESDSDAQLSAAAGAVLYFNGTGDYLELYAAQGTSVDVTNVVRSAVLTIGYLGRE